MGSHAPAIGVSGSSKIKVMHPAVNGEGHHRAY